MKLFSELIIALDQTNKTTSKVEALIEYFSLADEKDKLWAVALLSGRKPRSVVNATKLRVWATELSMLPPWLIDESYHVVGDLAETIALILPAGTEFKESKPLHFWLEQIISMQEMNDDQKKAFLVQAWNQMDYYQTFVFNKLLTGGFRIGVSQQLVVKALARLYKIKENVVAHSLMGNWSPDKGSLSELLTSKEQDISKPYPFYLAYALEQPLKELGKPEEWQAEWKWDGIRGQLIKRMEEVFLWSRGEELVTDKYPEIASVARLIPDGTVIDGEILPYKDGQVLKFNILQTRIGRKKLSPDLLKQAPVVLLAYDILEYEGNDIREKPLEERRFLLEKLINSLGSQQQLLLSEPLTFTSWEELTQIRTYSRENFSEGLMLKRKSSPYETGRKRGNWWKWKIDPLTIDAVLIYAQKGHGRRANWYTDYTFGVWNDNELIPFTKAYSGLTDKELQEVDAFVKKNTKEKFGPVRSVTPTLVFEIAFEGINASPRHKSGVALRFPRILRWRKDKPAKEADTLNHLKAILAQYGS